MKRTRPNPTPKKTLKTVKKTVTSRQRLYSKTQRKVPSFPWMMELPAGGCAAARRDSDDVGESVDASSRSWGTGITGATVLGGVVVRADGLSTGAPQFSQNFAPSLIGAPQFVQYAMAPPCDGPTSPIRLLSI